MRHTTILTVANDAGWMAEMRPTLCATGRSRLVVARSVEEAARLVDIATPQLIVVRDGESGPSAEQLAALLWANSIQEHPAAVAVMADQYDADRATALYQLGVDEYLAGDEHAGRAGAILLELALSRPAARAIAGVAIGARGCPRPHIPTSPTPGRIAVA